MTTTDSTRLNPLEAVAEQWGDNPVWMLNLLQFRNPYPGAGRDSYRRYVYEVRTTLAMVGGRMVMATFNAATFIGEQRWDAVILVQYPSMKHLQQMVTGGMPEYKTIEHWRTDAISDFGFIALHPGWAEAAEPDPTAVPVAPMSVLGSSSTDEWHATRWFQEPHAFRDTEGHRLSSSLLENPDLSGRLWCINLLKFKDMGTHPDTPDASGRETYLRGYGVPVASLVTGDFGGAFVYNDRSPVTVIGPKDAHGHDLGVQYDMVAIAQYPSRDAFLSMTHLPDYRRINKYREAGLQMQQLIAISPEGLVLEDGSVVGDDSANGPTKVLLTTPYPGVDSAL